MTFQWGFALTLALFAGPPAAAQQAGGAVDWNLSRRPDLHSTTASVNLGSQLVAVRCRDDSLDVLVGGLPATQSPAQPVILSFGPVVEERQEWTAIPGTPVISANNQPRLARLMKAGGTLDLRLPLPTSNDAPAASAPTYRLELPASSAAIDEVLTACNLALSSDADSLPHLSGPLTWLRQPMPTYPDIALQRGAAGAVEFVCGIEPTGRPRDCRVISSTRPGVGFEAAARRALNGTQLDMSSNPETTGRVVQFQIRFNPPPR